MQATAPGSLNALHMPQFMRTVVNSITVKLKVIMSRMQIFAWGDQPEKYNDLGKMR
jgi:hypothetical protein